jgi:hypothetical protein
MLKLVDRIRAEFRNWGQRLNYLQAAIVAYLVLNPGAPREVVNAIVPEAWRPVAAGLAAFASFLIVRSASNSDAKKAAGNG